MRLRTGLIHPPGRFSMRRVCFIAILMLVLVLESRAPLHTKAQESSVTPRMSVYFSRQTPPLSPLRICVDREYKIEARPVLIVGSGIGAVPMFGSVVVTNHIMPTLGTIDGTTKPQARIVQAGSAATFVYKSPKSGHARLWFAVVSDFVDLSKFANTNDVLISPIVSKSFEFEVQECAYNVTFVYSWQMAMGGASFSQSATFKTRVEVKDDATVEGNGFFEFSQVSSVPVCKTGLTEYAFPTRINGKMLPNTDELQLNFEFGTASMTLDASCEGQSGSKSQPQNASDGGMPTKATFPAKGGSQSFDTPNGLKPGKITITVEQVDPNTAQ